MSRRTQGWVLIVSLCHRARCGDGGQQGSAMSRSNTRSARAESRQKFRAIKQLRGCDYAPGTRVRGGCCRRAIFADGKAVQHTDLKGKVAGNDRAYRTRTELPPKSHVPKYVTLPNRTGVHIYFTAYSTHIHCPKGFDLQVPTKV